MKALLSRVLTGIIVLITIISLTTNLQVKAEFHLDQEEASWIGIANINQKVDLGVVAVNQRIYAIGGATAHFDTYEVTDTNQEYNPRINTWTDNEPMPTPRSRFGIAAHQNKIYCFGGYNGSVLDIAEVYDTFSDTWQTIAPMPTAETDVEACTIGDTIYMITPQQVHYAYDPQTNTYTTKAPLLENPGSCVIVALNNRTHVLSYGSSHQIYNPQTNTWTYGTPKNTTYFPVATVTSGEFAPKRIYVFGSNTIRPTVDAYDDAIFALIYNPETEQWTKMDYITAGHFDGGAATVDDRVFLISGGIIRPEDGTMFSGGFDHMYTPSLLGTIPQIKIISPLNKIYNQTTIPLEFTVNEQTSWMKYSIDNKENVTIRNNSTLTGLSPGLHTLTVYVRDLLFDTGFLKIAFRIGNLPPELKVLSPQNQTYYSRDVHLGCSIDEEIFEFKYSLDGSQTVSFNGNITLSNLAIGEHNVTIYATTLLGNPLVPQTVFFQVEPFPVIYLSIPAIAITVIFGFLYFRKNKKTFAKKKRRYVIAIVIVCTLLIGGTVGYYTLFNLGSIQELTPTPTPSPTPFNREIIYVPQNYSTIQQAINNANDGTTIQVKSGVYNEILTITKSVTLKGEDKQTTIINGTNNGPAILIKKDHVTVAGFTILNGDNSRQILYFFNYWGNARLADIHVLGANYCNITDNHIANSGCGIWLYESAHNSIINNTFVHNNYGVFVDHSSNNTIIDNRIEDSWGGIFFINSNDWILEDNDLVRVEYRYKEFSNVEEFKEYVHDQATGN